MGRMMVRKWDKGKKGHRMRRSGAPLNRIDIFWNRVRRIPCLRNLSRTMEYSVQHMETT